MYLHCAASQQGKQGENLTLANNECPAVLVPFFGNIPCSSEVASRARNYFLWNSGCSTGQGASQREMP